MSDISETHVIHVGQPLDENVEGHPARADSTTFVHARATLAKIMATMPSPWAVAGETAMQAHHGGSIWVWDLEWRIVLNWAGIEWSQQFAADPAKVELLRQNAEAVTLRFPLTEARLIDLGYADVGILHHPIVTGGDVTAYVDSIWNSCVPIPGPEHIGYLTAAAPLASGVHNYPEPACAIPRFCRSDFVPFVVDPGTGKVAVVVPVSTRGSGDGRVRVDYAEPGHPLYAAHLAAVSHGAALVLAPEHLIARAAFVHQVG